MAHSLTNGPLLLGPLLLGVDAGGTKTKAVVGQAAANNRFCILGTGEAGPGNPLSSGNEEAQRAIATAIAAATQGLSRSVDSAAFAIAGTRDPAVAAAMADWAKQQQFAQRVRIVTDFEPMLSAVNADGPAVGLIAGTGSVAFARDAEGTIHQVGGLGYLLGDEGSGFSIGRQAIRKAATARIETKLARLVAQTLELDDCSQAAAKVHAASDPRRLIASLAKPLLEAALDDEECYEIVQSEMQHLAIIAAGVIRLARLAEDPLIIGLGGSVLLHSQLARELFLEQLSVKLQAPELKHLERVDVRPIYDVLAGCLHLAAECGPTANR